MAEQRLLAKTNSGKDVYSFTLQGRCVTVTVTNYGAAIMSVVMPDKNGLEDEVTLTTDDIDSFMSNGLYLGATIGRTANRTKDGCFELNGQHIKLTQNDGSNHLHGGLMGFDKQIWDVAAVGEDSVKFVYISRNREEGYPGYVTATALYCLSGDELTVVYKAVCSEPTPVNMTNHTYFNLGGHKSGSILGHELKIDACFYAEADETLITTGQILSVSGTAFDFRENKSIGGSINAVHPMITAQNGFDVTLLRSGTGFGRAALYSCPQSGRRLEISSTAPCIHLYTGNFIDGFAGKDGALYQIHSGLCLEPQHLPGAVNHCHFAPIIAAPDRPYRQKICYSFGIDG